MVLGTLCWRLLQLNKSTAEGRVVVLDLCMLRVP
jgi:hypothetical protein